MMNLSLLDNGRSSLENKIVEVLDLILEYSSNPDVFIDFEFQGQGCLQKMQQFNAQQQPKLQQTQQQHQPQLKQTQ